MSATMLLGVSLCLTAPLGATASDATAPSAATVALPNALPAPAATPHAALPQIDAPPPAGPSVAERLAVIQARVESALVYPALAQRHGITGETQIAFSIDARGHAREIATRHADADREAGDT